MIFLKKQSYLQIYSNYKRSIIKLNLTINNSINSKESLVAYLNLYKNRTNKKIIIFADYYPSKNCYDKSAFSLFQYYLNNRIDIPYYIINSQSDFYISLLHKNKTNNMILYNETNLLSFYQDLYYYLKNTKIIVNAYSIPLLQYIAAYVPYINYLKINHGIKYFKVLYAKTEFINELGNKKNVICSSPFEYNLYVKVLKYNPELIYNASLARYERFQYIKKNTTEKKCILVSFTYRSYDKLIFENSKYKKNLEKLLNNNDLIAFLRYRNIELIYIPHHKEVELGKKYNQNSFKYCKLSNQSSLEHYIEQCSLLITDFSSISFDFMFQNKPVLFYSIDINDKNTIIEKKFFKKPNDALYFGNYFSKQNLLIDKIKYYINSSFIIGPNLRKKYESVFFYKNKIHKKLHEIINNIA